VEVARQIVTELVANAVEHTDASMVGASITRTGTVSARIVVTDTSRRKPAPGTPSPGDEDGRGLLLVTRSPIAGAANSCTAGNAAVRAAPAGWGGPVASGVRRATEAGCSGCGSGRRPLSRLPVPETERPADRAPDTGPGRHAERHRGLPYGYRSFVSSSTVRPSSAYRDGSRRLRYCA
jgi:hypothetical protein